MSEPVDLLMITWNRHEYVAKTVAALLDDPADFRLYCWDNASSDGTRDILNSLNDPRIVEKHFSPENVIQREPCLWFLDRAQNDVVGKVDDDILMPRGWIERIAPMIRSEPRFGMLGCWAFMAEDFDEELARKNFIRVGENEIFRCAGIGGCGFLARRELLKTYVTPKLTPGVLPIRRFDMTLDGLITGYPLPLLLAHHMDDPRSPHCVMTRESFGEQSSITARRMGFESVDDYIDWIKADAYERQRYSLARQIWWRRLERNHSLWGRLQRRLFGWLRPTPAVPRSPSPS